MAHTLQGLKYLSQPDGSPLTTAETMQHALSKLPPEVWISHTLPTIANNLLVVCELTDASCCVTFHQHGYKFEYNREIVL